MLCHFIVCFTLYLTVKLHLYVCSYYGLRFSNLIKETTYLLTYEYWLFNSSVIINGNDSEMPVSTILFSRSTKLTLNKLTKIYKGPIFYPSNVAM